ncbi:unnamed protein product [Urochloa decumbens]|uniref:PGG domain-containing protein n=1 Tax=Urochloa decumbens TaxID=240449 RepID=A0ABC8VMW9_9POAL
MYSTATADGGDKRCLLEGVTAEGSSALHIAASHGHLKLVETICDKDFSVIKARNNQLDDTPLVCAARAGHVDVADGLIKRALDQQETESVRALNWGGATAVHEAVVNGHLFVLRELMSKDTELAAVVDGHGVSPLYMAVMSNRADMVDLLIANGVKSPESYAGPDRQTALHAAVYANYAQEMSEALLCWEPLLAEKVDSSGRTALHYAASAGKAGVVVKLLLRNKSLAYIADNDGIFPVHAAARAGNIKVIREFMKICPSIDELLDSKRRSIVHYAVDQGRMLLVWHIYRTTKFARMMNLKDEDGNTPLHLAVKNGHVTVFSILMMDLRVNLGIMNHEGLTPLDVALIEGDHNYSFSSVMGTCIGLCLQLCKGYPSPSRNLTDKLLLEDKEKDLSMYTNVSQSILYISVLIATVSFAAAFTPPGGYIAEGRKAGMPVHGEYSEFFQYVTTNSIAFYLSTLATCLLVHASLTNTRMRSRRYYLACSVGLVYAAVLLMVTTFKNAVMLTLDPESLEDTIVYIISLVLGKAIWYGAVLLPISILAVPVCFRVAVQLRTSKHPWNDILKVLAAAILPIFAVYSIVIAPVVGKIMSGRDEPCSGHGCAVFSHPT